MKKLVIGLSLLVPALVFAGDSLEDKLAKQNGDKDFAKYVQSTAAGPCHANIEGTIDWSTWSAPTDGKKFGSKATSRCDAGVVGFQRLCFLDVSRGQQAKDEQQMIRETVAKDVTKVVCKGDAKGPKTFELKDKTFIIHTGYDPNGGAGSGSDDALVFLKKNLQ